jgi:hypothetical protein
MKDGLTVKVEGRLEVTPRRTALVSCDCGTGPRHLMFGALARMIASITAEEAEE